MTALDETRTAFDAVSRSYGDENDRNRVLREMRRRTVAEVTERLPPGSHLLDLGCGPGTDAEFFARRGYRVVAIDWSKEMAGEAKRRLRSAGLQQRASVVPLGIHELDRLNVSAFDGVYSDLGPLNCVPDLEVAARRIAERLRPGGLFVASVIGRVCPWEIGLYALKRDWKRIRVRFSHGLVPVPFYGGTVWTRYYAPKELEGIFLQAGFERVSLRALGILLPPPYLVGFAERHPRWIDGLAGMEDAIAALPGIRQWGDHFLLVLRKT